MNYNLLQNNGKFDSGVHSISEKQLLALDAMSKLANQFSNKPDFDKLISTLLLTLSGQFTVSDLFTLLKKPGFHDDKSAYIASGRFKGNKFLKSLKLSQEIRRYFHQHENCCKVSELETHEYDADFHAVLQSQQVEIICPIKHGDNLIGVIGMGKRVTKKDFEKRDIELFSTFINTITPLIASSYHFWELTHLSSWYLDILNNVNQGVFVFGDKYLLKNINKAGFNILKTFMPQLTLAISLQKMSIAEIFPEKIFKNWVVQFSSEISKTDSNKITDLVASAGGLRQEYDAFIRKISGDTGYEENIIITLDDITERKKAERQEKKLQDQLERAQRMESLGILAGGVAHDLNNMLGPLVGYPELMLMKLPEDSPLRKQVKIIGRSAKDAADVIQDLLTLARRGRYEMVATDFNEVIKNYLESPGFIELSRSHPNVEIKLNLAENIRFIQGSAAHLVKVVMNLIINAYDAMAEGGTLTIETMQENLKSLPGGYDEIENRDYIIMRVRDTGMGMDLKDIERIFEPYFSRKKMGSSGSGLGLSVVYGIVKDHKGYYDISSEIGKGTKFMVFFPVVDKLEKSNIEVNDFSGNEKVLVVDDIEEMRDLASALISSFGYTVKTAKNGHEAIEYLGKNDIDIVVIDMIMEKGFDGLDTYREILKIHAAQKAVIMSGYSSTERVEKMQELGAGKYIKKPFSRDMLGQAIREELDRKSVNHNPA